jgi:hypothetical protein
MGNIINGCTGVNESLVVARFSFVWSALVRIRTLEKDIGAASVKVDTRYIIRMN